jgi:predicted RNA-binding protein YlqC (UPF0109 family)
MKELLSFLIKEITGSDKYSIEEKLEDRQLTLVVKADPEIVGLIIGKEGKTIKNLRRILSVKAALEDKSVNISIES